MAKNSGLSVLPEITVTMKKTSCKYHKWKVEEIKDIVIVFFREHFYLEWLLLCGNEANIRIYFHVSAPKDLFLLVELGKALYLGFLGWTTMPQFAWHNEGFLFSTLCWLFLPPCWLIILLGEEKERWIWKDSFALQGLTQSVSGWSNLWEVPSCWDKSLWSTYQEKKQNWKKEVQPIQGPKYFI